MVGFTLLPKFPTHHHFRVRSYSLVSLLPVGIFLYLYVGRNGCRVVRVSD